MSVRNDISTPPYVEVTMIGGGNMGAALLGGMLESGRFDASSLAVVERVDVRRDELARLFPGVTVAAEVPPTSAAIIAVKPDGAASAVSAAVGAGATRILSIAAGVTLSALEAAAAAAAGRADGGDRSVAVIRAMPNTPALVGLGASAVAGGAGAGPDDLDWAADVLGSVGIVERLDEAEIDAFTGVAGSGPAYVFRFAEALTNAAVGEGFSPETADRVVAQLLLGASTLLDRDRDAARLRENVTSPGGTTAAGLARFDAGDLDALVADVVRAATERSRELGR